jgi:hypothetical protein
VRQFPLNGLTDFVIAATEELDQAKATAERIGHLEGDCSAQVRDDVDIDQQIHELAFQGKRQRHRLPRFL